MRSCIRIPRLFLPQGDLRKWTVLPPDCLTRQDAEQLARRNGDAPSAFSLVLPDVLAGDDTERRLAALLEAGYRALEEGDLKRLDRGFVLTERTTDRGVRRGILACVDLEEFSAEGGKEYGVRALKETDRALVSARLSARGSSLLEFSHAVICFRDKKDKLFRSLEDEEPEKLYDFELPSGGRLAGYFLPEFIAADVAHDLMSKADPCFGVLDGTHFLAAAKAHWEKIRGGLTLQEARSHPARFALAEFVNLLDDSVAFSDSAPEKSELLSALKAGRRYPAKSFALADPRCLLEGREISYD